MKPKPIKGIGKAAYEAYAKAWGEAVHIRLWKWGDISEKDQVAWVAAAKAAVKAAKV